MNNEMSSKLSRLAIYTRKFHISSAEVSNSSSASLDWNSEIEKGQIGEVYASGKLYSTALFAHPECTHLCSYMRAWHA